MGITATPSEQDAKKTLQKKPNDTEPRKLDKKHVGGGDTQEKIQQPVEGQMTDHIKKYDPQNESGSSPHQLDFMDKLLKMGGSGTSSVGDIMGGGLMNQMFNYNQQVANTFQCPDGYFWNPSGNNFQGNCHLNCNTGEVWDVNLQMCVPDTSDSNFKVNTIQPLPNITIPTAAVPPTVLDNWVYVPPPPPT
jgi:hypothetical protein